MSLIRSSTPICMKKLDENYREKIQAVIKKVANVHGRNNIVHAEIMTSDDENKWVSCRISALAEGCQVVIWDIDEERKLQIELEQMAHERAVQQKLLQDIVDSLPSLFYTKNTKGKYVLVNKAMIDFTEMPKEKIIGSTFFEVYKDEAAYEETKKADLYVLKNKVPYSYEYTLNKKGEKRYLWSSKFPLFDENGFVKYICSVVNDITERKNMELNLVSAKKEADGTRIAQETFLANVSHEIRTPMNGIIGMANLLMSTPLDKEQREFIENIQESSNNLLAIINDILDFSKIHSGKFKCESAPFKIRQLIKKAIYPLQFKAEEKRIKLNLHIDNSLPEVLIGDPVRLQQIIINLTGNAIKFTSTGSVDVVIKGGSHRNQMIYLNVDVIDTGIGIPENKVSYIFESFTQTNINTSRKYGGTGLGLAIVKELVELQGGAVSVKSELGKGSVFSFFIPYAIGTEIPVAENQNNTAKVNNNMLTGMSILVAEDNIINQRVVKHTLQKQGAEVKIANNGKEAIECMQSNDFDVILMDLQMPKMDGYAATRYIREQMKKEVPIIAMTADALKGEAEKCFDAGMAAYISKPFEPNDLYRLILKITTEHKIVNLPQSKKTNIPLLDFSFLYEISDNDPSYIYDVIDLFLSAMPEGLNKLEKLVAEGTDWDGISRQAHSLKSSVSVIKIREMYENLNIIETLSKQKTGLEEIRTILDNILVVFNEALPLLLEEREKNKTARV